MYDPQEIAQRFSEVLEVPITSKDQAIVFWAASADSYGVAAAMAQTNLDAMKGLEGKELDGALAGQEINPDALSKWQDQVDYYAAFVGRVHELLVLLKGQDMPEGGLGPVVPESRALPGATLVASPLLMVEDAIRFCEQAFPVSNKPPDRVEGARYAAMVIRSKETLRVLRGMAVAA